MTAPITPQQILTQINKNDLMAAADDVKVLLTIDWPTYVTPTGQRIQSKPTPQLRDAYYALRWILGSESKMPTDFSKIKSQEELIKWWQSTQDEISRNALEFTRSVYRQSTSAKQLALSRAGLGKGGELSPPSLGVYGLEPGDVKLVGQTAHQFTGYYPSAVTPFTASSVPFVPPIFTQYAGPEEPGSII